MKSLGNPVLRNLIAARLLPGNSGALAGRIMSRPSFFVSGLKAPIDTGEPMPTMETA